VLKAVKRLRLLRGDSVLVAGQGPIGLMFTKILSLRGIHVAATDLLESRLRLALAWGARKAFQAGSKRLVDEVRASFPCLDAAVIAVPSEAAAGQAMELVRGSGQVLLFAHTRKGEPGAVDFGSVCQEEKDLIGSYSSDFTLQKEVSRLVFSRRLDVRKLVTHALPLEQTAVAVAIATQSATVSAKLNSLKVVVDQTLAC
jgi:L-iditol 2-dehydrogenase